VSVSGQEEVLWRYLSKARSGPYLAAAEGDSARALRLYAWNMEVSGAFLGPLHVLEVCLRNAVDDRLTVLAGRPDWWRSDIRFTFVAERMIQDSIRKCQIRSDLAPGHMIAELPFGFWVGLFGSGGSCQYETNLWRPALRTVFPGYRGSRRGLHSDLDHVRAFRNRVAHHEPIHRRHLAADRETIIRLLRLMSPAVANWVLVHDRMSESLARRAAVTDGAVQPRF
jgi:hypothetical protein